MKTLNKILGFALVAVVFASCSKDDTTDYTLKDISPLKGPYSGQCVIMPQNIPGKSNISETTTVEFVETDNSVSYYLKTDEFGLITSARITNFKNSKDGKDYTFSMGGFEKKGSDGMAIPSYIQQWVGDRYVNIKRVDLKLSATSGTFVKDTRTLTFTYQATATVVGVVDATSGQTKTDTYTISFQYAAIKN